MCVGNLEGADCWHSIMAAVTLPGDSYGDTPILTASVCVRRRPAVEKAAFAVSKVKLLLVDILWHSTIDSIDLCHLLMSDALVMISFWKRDLLEGLDSRGGTHSSIVGEFFLFLFLFLHCLSTVHFHFPRYTKSELLVALVVLPWSWQPGWQLFCCPQRSSFGVIQYFLPPKLPTHHLTTFVHLLDQTFSIWYEIKQSQPQQGYCCVRHVMFSGSVSTI